MVTPAGKSATGAIIGEGRRTAARATAGCAAAQPAAGGHFLAGFWVLSI
jgi:hypothetical protein